MASDTVWTLITTSCGFLPTTTTCAPCYLIGQGASTQAYPYYVTTTTISLIPLATLLPNGSLWTTGTSTLIIPSSIPGVLPSGSSNGTTATRSENLTWIWNQATLTYPTVYISYEKLVRADGQVPAAGCTPARNHTPSIASTPLPATGNLTFDYATPWSVASWLSLIQHSTSPAGFNYTKACLSLSLACSTNSSVDWNALYESVTELNSQIFETIAMPSLTVPWSTALPSAAIPVSRSKLDSPVSTTTSISARWNKSSNVLPIKRALDTNLQPTATVPVCDANLTVLDRGVLQVAAYTCSVPSSSYDVIIPSYADPRSLVEPFSGVDWSLPPDNLRKYLDSLPLVQQQFDGVPLEQCGGWYWDGDPIRCCYSYLMSVATLCPDLEPSVRPLRPSCLVTTVRTIDAACVGAARTGQAGSPMPLTATLLTTLTGLPVIAGLSVVPVDGGIELPANEAKSVVIQSSGPQSSSTVDTVTISPGAQAIQLTPLATLYPSTESTSTQPSSDVPGPGNNIAVASPEYFATDSRTTASRFTSSGLPVPDPIEIVDLPPAFEIGPLRVLGAAAVQDNQPTIENPIHESVNTITSGLASIMGENPKTIITLQDSVHTTLTLPDSVVFTVVKSHGEVRINDQSLDSDDTIMLQGHDISLDQNGGQLLIATAPRLSGPDELPDMDPAMQQTEALSVERSGTQILVNGQPLTPSTPEMIAGHTVSRLVDGNGILVDGTTGFAITLSDGQQTAINFNTLASVSSITISHSGTELFVGSSVLSPGDAITVAGQTFSLDTAGYTAYINGQATTDSVFTITATIYPVASTNAGSATVNSQAQKGSTQAPSAALYQGEGAQTRAVKLLVILLATIACIVALIL